MDQRRRVQRSRTLKARTISFNCDNRTQILTVQVESAISRACGERAANRLTYKRIGLLQCGRLLWRGGHSRAIFA